MKCPKCGFESSGESCAKCGVVFAKVGAPRRPRPASVPSPPPAPQRQGTSILNVLALASVVVVVGLVVWKFAGSSEPDVPQADSPEGPRPEPQWSGVPTQSDSPDDGEGSSSGGRQRNASRRELLHRPDSRAESSRADESGTQHLFYL